MNADQQIGARVTGDSYIVGGVLLLVSTRLLGVQLARTRPCRLMFWIRVVFGTPLYLLGVTMIYHGFLVR